MARSDTWSAGTCDRCEREAPIVELTLSMFEFDEVCLVCLSKLEEIEQ